MPAIDVDVVEDHPGHEVIVVGGYGSGIDAAIRFVQAGRRVTVVDRQAPWEVVDADPSRMLSPHSHGRLREAFATERLDLLGDTEVRATSHDAARDPIAVHLGPRVHDGPAAAITGDGAGPAPDGWTVACDGPPLLATASPDR